MNKLQKLYENNILFTITFSIEKPGQFFWAICEEGKSLYTPISQGLAKNPEFAIENLWEEAKRYYPDAKCFKEEMDNEPLK